ncbi:MAG: SWIM zinc finger family protein [Candidatus Thiodiazotropha sp. 6PLUC2]
MTLRSMILSHDSMALETLTSKGLLRRAQRDVEAGLGTIENIDDNKATVTVGKASVDLDEKGPKAATCTCKAHGICRHILVAVLLLREQSSSVEETPNEPKPSSALEEICALKDEQIIKFSGADWSKSLALISDNPKYCIIEEGLNVAVLFEEMDTKVTFIGSSGLKGAAYKGPKTRKRLLSTVAALLVRQKEGLQLSDSSYAIGTGPSIDNAFINSTQLTIEQAVTATLSSRSPLGHDLLLDLAISSRCESLPRLSAELRALSRQARASSERSIDFDPADFFLRASRAYTLLEALRNDPTNQILTGSIKREYKSGKPMEVWPLAVSRWRSTTGARGLSAYIFDPVSCEWLTMLEGRSAGIDLSFDVSTAYQMPVWGFSTLRGVMGRRVHLAKPLIASDGAISSKSQHANHDQPMPISLGEILESNGVHDEWSSFRRDVEIRLGHGIGRRQVQLPAMIIPSSYGQVGFDDINQVYMYEVRDKLGDTLILNIPADDNQTAIRLWKMGRDVQGLVVETSFGLHGLDVRPVSIIFNDSQGVAIHNIDFDFWKRERGIKKLFSNFRESVAKPLVAHQTNVRSPFQRTLSDSIDELISLVCHLPGENNTRLLVSRLESFGFSTFADAFEKATYLKDLKSILKAGFVASEIDEMLKF